MLSDANPSHGGCDSRLPMRSSSTFGHQGDIATTSAIKFLDDNSPAWQSCAQRKTSPFLVRRRSKISDSKLASLPEHGADANSTDAHGSHDEADPDPCLTLRRSSATRTALRRKCSTSSTGGGRRSSVALTRKRSSSGIGGRQSPGSSLYEVRHRRPAVSVDAKGVYSTLVRSPVRSPSCTSQSPIYDRLHLCSTGGSDGGLSPGRSSSRRSSLGEVGNFYEIATAADVVYGTLSCSGDQKQSLSSDYLYSQLRRSGRRSGRQSGASSRENIDPHAEPTYDEIGDGTDDESAYEFVAPRPCTQPASGYMIPTLRRSGSAGPPRR